MAARTMLDRARLAVRRNGTNVFDDELTDLINAAALDLGIAGIKTDTFDATGTYEPGDRVIYNGMYYVCIIPITSGHAFDASEWAEDGLIIAAIMTYIKMNFGESDLYDRFKASYDEQKAQLRMATGYTDWRMP